MPDVQADACSCALPIPSAYESRAIPWIGWTSTNAPLTLSRAGFPVRLVKPAAIGALSHQLLHVRRAVTVVPASGVVGALLFVGALRVSRSGRRAHAACLPGALEVVGVKRYGTLACTAAPTCLGLSSSAPATFQTLSDDDISLAAELLDGVAFLLVQVVEVGELNRETFGSLGASSWRTRSRSS
jgi:hypothetical protein